ncbi:MAG: guanylate kinase [Oscillospiraceae bacterium]|nr:guanylate kinase [Oscillospiraceae bacterium]
MKGSVVVVSGPSGAGKTTVIGLCSQHRSDLYFSVSVTTREKRPGEEEGVDYHFVTQEEFDRMVDEGLLLEHAGYVNHSYGTPAAPVAAAVERGLTVVLDIEVQGAAQIKQKLPDSTLIFLTPTHLSELERRLIKRGTETPETVSRRLETAAKEIKQADRYDYIILNDDADTAASELDAIITASRCRTGLRYGMLDTNI